MEHSKLEKFFKKHPTILEQQRKKYSKKTGMYSLISTEPPIFYVPRSLRTGDFTSLAPIFNYLQYRTAYFLQNWVWDMEDPHEVRKIREMENQHISQYPKHEFIHLCNTQRQREVFQEYNLKAVFCNQNSLLDEKIFRPLSSIPKVFNAVYDARLSPYKRHYLARKIDSIAFVYYYDFFEDMVCYQEVKSLFPHAHYFNEAFTEVSSENNKIFIPPYNVNQCLNACKVGLCLSSVEGAMYASMQYLLSGLPVVSTKSKGGRDVFFDEEYTLIVEDNPDAVKEGVDELVRRNISPETIRLKVLEKVKHHRRVLISLIQSIYDQEGINRDFSMEWNQLFFNKFRKPQPLDLAIKQLELVKS